MGRHDVVGFTRRGLAGIVTAELCGYPRAGSAEFAA